MGQSSSSYKTRSSVAAMRGDLRVNARAMLVAYTSIIAWAFFARADAPPKIVQRRKRTIMTRILMICILDRDFGLRRELLHFLGVKRWVMCVR
jgi:predicted ATP-grasp superfamily ATP-dependent carboligase